MQSSIAGVNPTQGVPISITNSGSSTKNPFKKLYDWYFGNVTIKKVAVTVSIFLVLIIIIIGGIYFIVIAKPSLPALKQQKKVSQTSPTPTPTPIAVENPLTGELVSGSAVQNLARPPLAVMIENSLPARPQTGLNQADIVYETLAEGGITRFMAVFLGNTPKLVGPVRSARTYFLPWAAEYNAIYSHWGENSDVTPLLVPDAIRNVDALVMPKTDASCAGQTYIFCRDYARQAPHNGYGFPAKIWNYSASIGWSGTSSIAAWAFKPDAPVPNRGKDGASLNIDFMVNDPFYAVKWVFNKNSNTYVRYNGGVLQTDRTDNSQITTKNIIVQYVNGNLYTSASGKVVYNNADIGSGKASMFFDGNEIDGTWKKPSLAGRTQFFDATGKPVQFDVGKTWITVLVNNTGSFNYTN